MSTFFSFPVHSGEEREYEALVVNHLEHLLLLGDFIENIASRPTDIALRSRPTEPLRLFANPDQHLWMPTAVSTTKIHLHAIRLTQDVDQHYDIDVLRMTEPRILFIKDSLERINQLPLVERERLLEFPKTADARSEGDTDLVAVAFSTHLSDVLGNVMLFSGDRQLRPSGFQFRRLPKVEKPLHLGRYGEEEIFSSLLKCFSAVAKMEVKNNRICSFSLLDYEHWLEDSSGEPFEILGVLSRDCNAKCDFCYVLGNPSNTAIKLQKFSVSKSGEEAEARLRFFRRGRTLPVPTYDTEELMTHPKFFEICEGIRESSSKCISITTNGYRIDERSVLRLKALAPIDISLSLNAKSTEIRQWLMGGPSARGIRALRLLHEHGIPCALTVAAWPRVPIEEMIETVRYAANFNLRSISLLLGGYTKYFPTPPEYPIPGYWNQVIDAIGDLRLQFDVPFIIQPRLYEEQYRFSDRIGKSLITGINPKSAASRAGLKIYDEIVEIDGAVVESRNQCLSLLTLAAEHKQTAILGIQRNSNVIRLQLDPIAADPTYLYGAPFNDRLGIHLIGENIRVSSIRRIFELISVYKAERATFLTSMIVKPLLADLLNRYSFLCDRDVEIDLQVVPNSFLGGNIVMGDMLVLDDFRDFISSYLKRESTDLVMLPSGPFNHGGWLRDMKGQPYELLRRSFDVPIEMIEAPYFE